MNRLTKQEFQDRINAVARAMGIFGKITEGNVTEAFTLYQAVLAEQDRSIFIESATSGNRPPALFDKFERPKCPECGASLMFRLVADNPEGTKVQLVCESVNCDVVLNSTMSIDEWAKELRDAGRSEQTQ